MPVRETNEFGRKGDFTLLESSSPEAFARDCADLLKSQTLLAAPVQELLQEARSHGVKVIVVEMPMHPAHLNRFYNQPVWTVFRDKTREAVSHYGADYIDASHWAPDSQLFEDSLHLSHAGAFQFSQLLAQSLLGTRVASNY